LSLDVRQGEFLTLLGPSGCGKTTTLRMIAGFAEPDGGRVWLHGEDITELPPDRRNIGMVYQQYALFPHMSVFENVAFGLRVRKLPAQEIRSRVEAALERVRLQDLARRLPRTLSGGQQQRVALARALVIEPTVLLLDEPLSNLDAKLRREMQLELRRLQHELAVTTIYVTHDQAEALALSDRIAVMNAGRVEQVDGPATVYHRPLTAFVAGFVGQTNLLSGTVVSGTDDGNEVRVEPDWTLSTSGAFRVGVGARVLVVVRPEAVALHESPVDNAPRGEVLDVVYGGASIQYRVMLPGSITVLVEQPNPGMRPRFRPGSIVWMTVAPEAVTLLAESSEA
jgi:spermidine/putrescine ABC transporter ATP-binding subunit